AVGRSGVEPAEVDPDLRHAGAGEIADRDGVGAAGGGDLDVLHVDEVHGDGADIARERHVPASRGGDVHRLGDVGAVELQRVEAVAAVDRVGAVAGIPRERVVAGAEPGRVAAAAADDEIIAIAADQRVVAVAAGDPVVAGAAVEGEVDQVGETILRRDDVIAATGVEHEILGGADVEGERRRGDAVEAHARAVGRDGGRLRPGDGGAHG